GGAANCFARFTAVDRNGANHSQWRLQHRVPIKLFVDDESNRPGASELQNDRIHPGDVIGHKQEAARREIFEPDSLYPVNEPSKPAGEQIKRVLRSRISQHFFYVYNCFVSLCNRVMTNQRKSAATFALALLLAINLFNYIDRYVLAAVLPTLKQEFLAGDPHQNFKAGWWTSAFLMAYFLTAPIFGLLADRFSRWLLVGIGVALWSLASGWSGMATSFAMLLCTRLFVGIGEAGYGPAAPTIIADLYPLTSRGRVLAWFYVAIPVGSALGYALGGKIGDLLGWRWAFYLVVPPGLFLAAVCFFMPEPRKSADVGKETKPRLHDYLRLLRIRSYLLNTAAMTVMTFAIGGFSAWMPDYIFLDRGAEFGASEHTLGHI